MGECDCDLYADDATVHTSGIQRLKSRPNCKMRELMLKIGVKKIKRMYIMIKRHACYLVHDTKLRI